MTAAGDGGTRTLDDVFLKRDRTAIDNTSHGDAVGWAYARCTSDKRVSIVAACTHGEVYPVSAHRDDSTSTVVQWPDDVRVA